MNLRILSSVPLVIAAAVLWTCAATASATVVTTGEGELYTDTIKAESEGSVVWDGTINVTCGKSSFEGTVISHHPEDPATGELSSLSFSECGNHTVTVAKPGTLELNATSGGDGTLASSGAEITILTHSLFVGTRHCIYATEETELGAFTGSGTTKGNATVDLEESPIPQSPTDSLCGEDAALTGSYKITTASTLELKKPATTLCKVSPENKGSGIFKCPAKEEYAGTVYGELTGPGNLKGYEGETMIGTISCDKIKMEGKFTEKGAPNGGISEFALTSGAGGPCSSELVDKPPVKITMEKPPYATSFFLYGPKSTNNGLLYLSRAPDAPFMELEISGKTCEYKAKFKVAAGWVVNGAGGTPTSASFTDLWEQKTGGASCPPAVRWDFKLSLLRPGTPTKPSLYLANE